MYCETVSQALAFNSSLPRVALGAETAADEVGTVGLRQAAVPVPLPDVGLLRAQSPRRRTSPSRAAPARLRAPGWRAVNAVAICAGVVAAMITFA